MKLILSWALLVFLSTSVWAESSEEKLLKLQAANDALSERVAELLQENRRLQQAVKDALSAQSTGTRVAVGCDATDLQRSMAVASGKTGKKMAAMRWLKKSGEKCTKDQLRLIISKLPSWGNDTDMFFIKDAVILAQYFLEN